MPVQSVRPTLVWPAELLLKVQDVRLAIFDVDGVLTDGGLYYSERGETLKRFHVLDGHGLKLLVQAGITPAIISGRDSKPLRTRLDGLGIQHVHLGVPDKLQVAQGLLQRLKLEWSDVAAMGDDWPDLPILARARFACAPPGAHAEALALADHVTRHEGGHGAVRELCDLLLVASTSYRQLLQAASGVDE